MRWAETTSEIPNKMASPDATIPYYGNKILFIENYTRLIDFMSEIGLEYLLIWGLLRDSHGGVDAAIKICEHAHDKKVKIIAGIGTQGYGGIYYEGNHEFNSSTWIAKHPELSENTVQISQNATINLRGKEICPSNPRNIDWLTRGVEWLLTSVPVDGLYLENGDYINCACPICNKKRMEVEDICEIYFRSLTISYQPVLDFVRKHHPDIFVINTLYSGFNKKFLQDHSGLFKLSQFDNTYNMWTLTNTSKKENWEKGIEFDNNNNIGYFHYFSSANNSHQMNFAQRICENFNKLTALKFKGAAIYGEEPANSIVALINYITFAKCVNDSSFDSQFFLKKELSERVSDYGFDIDLVHKELDTIKDIHFGSQGL